MHGLPDALIAAGITAFADTAYTGLGPRIRSPYRRIRYDRATARFTPRPSRASRRRSTGPLSALRAPGERANADLKNWRILRKTRSSPTHATQLVNAVRAVILNS